MRMVALGPLGSVIDNTRIVGASGSAAIVPGDPQKSTLVERIFTADAGDRMPPPKSPEEALATMRLRDGFQIELVAAEPVVIDPVYLDWDAQGRLYVVEMRDYPLGLDGKGQIGGVVAVWAKAVAAARSGPACGNR